MPSQRQVPGNPSRVGTIGEAILKLRRERGWSVHRLSQESGIGRGTIAALEHGTQQRYQYATILRIARAFGKSPSELEAMVEHSHARRASDQDLAPEWVAFTRRVMRLPRMAQAALQMLLLALEDFDAMSVGQKPTQPSDQSHLPIQPDVQPETKSATS